MLRSKTSYDPPTMAGTSLLTLIDDIATLLDDVSVMSKVAAKKTAGVLGDDLALNAQQVSGVAADRELPVVWAVAKGSLVNKLILVPAALLISALIPWMIIPLLMAGGAFLCFEGFEKIVHKNNTDHAKQLAAIADPAVNLVEFEKDKIKGAIRTDFILSAEIIVITLGTVVDATFGQQVLVLSAMALIMTLGVYGFVAGIVKLDDVGVYLSRRPGDLALRKMQRCLGLWIVRAAPWLMKTLSLVGTAAMFLVGGGIIVHGLHHWLPPLQGALLSLVVDGLVGVATGAVVLCVVSFVQMIRRKLR